MKKHILMLLAFVMWGMMGQVCVAKPATESDYYLRLCTEKIDQGNYDEAMGYANQHVEEYPTSANGYYYRMVINASLKKYANALLDVNNCIKYCKNSPDIMESTLYWWRATIYEKIEMYYKALDDFTKAYKLALKEKDAATARTILSARAELYYTLKDYDKADADYKLMLKQSDLDLMAMIGLARNMIARGNYNEAVEFINQMEKIDASYNEIYHYRMKAYDGLGQTKKAIDDALKYIEKCENIDRDEYEPILQKDLDYTLLKLNALCKSDPDNMKWKYLRIGVYGWKDDYLQVVKEYTHLMEQYGDIANFYYYRSFAYDELGLYDRAIADMNKYIAMSSETDITALLFRAKYYDSNNQYAEAIVDLSTIIDNNPMLPMVYRSRGWLYERMGDYSSALADYSTGLTIDDASAELYYTRGRLYHFQGKKELAELDLNRVLESDTLVKVDSRRQYALLFLGRNDEAIAWMDSIVAAYPNDEDAYYEKACVLSLMGRTTEAIEALRTAFEKGYRNLNYVEKDTDLDAIKQLPAFIALLDEYKSKIQIIVEEHQQTVADSIAVISEVPMKKMYSGIYEIACEVNGLPLKFVFDTGASSVTISSVEAQFMLKNGYLKSEDIKGKEYFSVATGEIGEGTIIRLKKIKVGDAVLRNVDASVVHNQQAPLLLGQSVLERFGTITIDNINSKLIIKQ